MTRTNMYIGGLNLDCKSSPNTIMTGLIHKTLTNPPTENHWAFTSSVPVGKIWAGLRADKKLPF